MMRKRAISCGGRVQTYTEEEGNRVEEARQTDAKEDGNQSAEEEGNHGCPDYEEGGHQMLRKMQRKRETR